MNTTSPSIATLIAEGDPLTPPDWNEDKERHLRERVEQVRLHSVARFSSGHLYQAAAAKDPRYWETFNVGIAP